MQARLDAWPVLMQGEETGKVQLQQSRDRRHDRRHDRRTWVVRRELPNQTETSSSGGNRSGSARNGDREDHEIRIVGDPAEEGSPGFSSPGTQSF